MRKGRLLTKDQKRWQCSKVLGIRGNDATLTCAAVLPALCYLTFWFLEEGGKNSEEKVHSELMGFRHSRGVKIPECS